MARGPAQCVRTAARTGDHRRYQKERAVGTILRTKVPHGSRDEIGDDLFRHILRDQLRATEEQFWGVVRGGATILEPPTRPRQRSQAGSSSGCSSPSASPRTRSAP